MIRNFSTKTILVLALTIISISAYAEPIHLQLDYNNGGHVRPDPHKYQYPSKNKGSQTIEVSVASQSDYEILKDYVNKKDSDNLAAVNQKLSDFVGLIYQVKDDIKKLRASNFILHEKNEKLKGEIKGLLTKIEELRNN